jgi:hypothetical protein
MAEWDRRTPWRQGHTLTSETASRLGLVGADDSGTALALVVSHDCDLTQTCEIEPLVEVVIGRPVAAADGNFTHAKNPRRLHLAAEQGGAALYLDLLARDKRLVPKERLAGERPDQGFVLAPRDRSVLQRWLAARYRRSAFADEFDRRLHDRELHKRIAKIVEPLGEHLIAIFFDVDEGKDVEREGAADVYTLNIDLLYSTRDPEVARAAAENAAKKIAATFRKSCYVEKEDSWKDIELKGCEPISDMALTYADSVLLKKWNADYLSFRSDGAEQPVLSE